MYVDRLNIDFGTTNNGTDDYDEVVNKGELFRVMSTVTTATKMVMKKFPRVDIISFDASKNFTGDGRREKLYMAFLRKQANVEKVWSDIGGIYVKFKPKRKTENINEEEDFYQTEIDYEYEAPSGEKRKRTITYGSVLAQGEDHPLYNKVQQELEDYKEDKELEEVLKKVSDGWGVFSKKGKKLGTHKTKKKAQAQLAAIEISKKKS
jgi:hypothetical protein